MHIGSTSDGFRTLTPSRRAVAVAVAGASLALFGAGCGSGASPTGSSLRRSRQNDVSAAFSFSDCMRNHGVTDFPDPKVSSGNGHQSVIMAIPAGTAGTPGFKAAQKACQGILPAPQNLSPAQLAAQQHAREQTLLSFARCLRVHGLPNFPDPNSQGQLTLEMVNAAGIDLHAPAVLTAAKSCVGVTHGAITGADVERAINGGQ